DVNAVFGGPIKQNTLWFLLAQRVSQTNNLIPLPTQYFPQGGQSDSGGQVAPHSTVRLTWQATQKNKIVWAFYKSQGGTRRFDVGCTATSFNSVSCISPEAAYWLPTPLQYASQIKWTAPLTGRLLLEVGQSFAVPTYKFNYQDGVGPLDIQHVNATTSVRTVASGTAPQDYFSQTWNTVVYAQDRWTFPRLTLTYGARYDYFNASTPAESDQSGRFMTATAQAARTNIAPVSCVPCWKDWAVRFGASYDLFGTGKTALKMSIGKFVGQQALGLASSVNPLAAQTDARTWSDLDRNGTIFDASGNVQLNEIVGPTRNNN